MSTIIKLSNESIDNEHICCAISDKKSVEGYNLKKEWLKSEFKNGYVFQRLDERAKVFIEYGDSEQAWAPIVAKNYLFIQCFWVAGSYKGKGYGKALISHAVDTAKAQKKDGLLIITGKKKMHFLADGNWLLKNGFKEIDKTDSGFTLLSYKIDEDLKDAQTETETENTPKFKDQIYTGECDNKKGLTVYYSDRCPYTDYYVNTVLKESAIKRDIPIKSVHLKTVKDAQNSPAPSTIFSLFYNGKFLTTDVSVCLESKFNKTIK